jgi:ElaB/YqjD/DUF883 family membrane-anchored ribosome-binding protein
VLSRDVVGADVLLFRPDGGTPGSDLHPYRAARIELSADLSLEPGPVAVFAQGSFAGEGLIDRSAGGEVTYVPFAVDGATSVVIETMANEQPQRLMTVARGIATVENAAVHTTRYLVTAGAIAPPMIYISHALLPGYSLPTLPPGSEVTADHVLIALPISAGKTTTFTVEQRQPITRHIELLDDRGADLAAYLEGSSLPASATANVRTVVTARAELADAERASTDSHDALADATEHASDLERSLATVAKLPGAEAATLRARLLKSLTAASATIDQHARAIAAGRAREVEARIKLQTAIEVLTLELLDER